LYAARRADYLDADIRESFAGTYVEHASDDASGWSVRLLCDRRGERGGAGDRYENERAADVGLGH